MVDSEEQTKYLAQSLRPGLEAELNSHEITINRYIQEVHEHLQNTKSPRQYFPQEETKIAKDVFRELGLQQITGIRADYVCFGNAVHLSDSARQDIEDFQRLKAKITGRVPDYLGDIPSSEKDFYLVVDFLLYQNWPSEIHLDRRMDLIEDITSTVKRELGIEIFLEDNPTASIREMLGLPIPDYHYEPKPDPSESLAYSHDNFPFIYKGEKYFMIGGRAIKRDWQFLPTGELLIAEEESVEDQNPPSKSTKKSKK